MAKAKKRSPHARQLATLEATLAKTTDAAALSALAREFHSVNHALGHDLAAIVADPGLVDRAIGGKVTAYERASAAYVSVGNLRHGLHCLFEALDAFPPTADRDRLAASIARLLDDPLATRLRTELAALPAVADEQTARDAFYKVVWRIKDEIAWDRLPR